MKKAIHVYDIDGVLVDSTHRYRTKNGKIDLDYWIKHDKEEYIMQDSLLPLAEQYKEDLKNPEVYVVIATARACVKGDANYKFIERYLGMPDKFIHRQGREDNRKGGQLKANAIRPLLNLKQFQNCMVKVWEDNKDYLQYLIDKLGAIGHYVPSNQGH